MSGRDAELLAKLELRVPKPKLQPTCACGGEGPTCRAEQLSQDHEVLHTSRAQCGRSAGTTPVGLRLLAHELLHTVQQ